jgi:hypothetical protein
MGGENDRNPSSFDSVRQNPPVPFPSKKRDNVMGRRLA